ncbi:hypothetical protein ACPCHQ_21855 [Ralstonia thomasii]|uniref:hypothetical protein n=1 Tax=Ralstonia thomasii TaxID=3058596 RepID=UPI003C2CA4D4
MKKVVFGALLATVAGLAQAQTVSCNGLQPVVTLTYATGADAGMSGLLYMGMLSPDQSTAVYWNPQDSLQVYQNGMPAPNRRFDAGVPATQVVTRPFPGQDTYAFNGWTLYIGHGVLTDQDKALVQKRHDVMAAAKPARVAAGTWNAAYDDDEHYMQAMVERNMRQGNKYHSVMTIPVVDCRPATGN